VIPPAPTDPKPKTGRANNCYAVGNLTHSTFKALTAITNREESSPDDLEVVLGGDHSVAIGSIAAALQASPDTGVVWVSAHGGLNTPSSTLTGNIHGMVLRLLMQSEVNHLELPGFEWLATTRHLDLSRLVMFGVRDLDPAEVDFLRSHGALCLTMHDIDLVGIGEAMDIALDHLKDSKSLHVSYDLNVIDPSLALGTYDAVLGGLTFREAHFVAEELALSGRVTSMDMVGVNPSRQQVLGSATLDMAIHLVGSVLGRSILSSTR